MRTFALDEHDARTRQDDQTVEEAASGGVDLLTQAAQRDDTANQLAFDFAFKSFSGMRQQTDLHRYQERIATFFYENDQAICTARPGSRKTAAALTAIVELLRDKVIRHALVLAPKRVARATWPDEIALWAHMQGLYYAVLTGSPTERAAALASTSQRQMTIIGLDLIGWLIEQLAKLPDDHPLLDLLVIDEISKLRNPKGKRANALAQQARRWKMIWGLSGTLRPNGPQDLFMPARIVTRGKLWGRSFYQWRQKNFYQSDPYGYDWSPLPGAENRLNTEIAPLITTLGPDDMIELPELSVIIDRVELPEEAWLQYDLMRTEMMAETDGVEVIVDLPAIATGKLAQLANGFIYEHFEEDADGHRPKSIPHRVHDAKREWLVDLIEEAAAPMLLVYEFLEDLKLMREVLGEDLPYLGAGVGDAKSDRWIKEWNAGKLPFMALHPASGGHGLNLQHGGADMAWIAPTWSPELWEQTIGRLHRSGQTKPVFVRVCVASGTVDQLKLNRVYFKMSAQQAFERFLKDCETRK